MRNNKDLIKISKGHYTYKGIQINCIGYYPPEKRVVWEAVDKDGCGFCHSFSLKDTIRLIDENIRIELKKQLCLPHLVL
ncbi:hypothetical protein [Odoribacter splanchnicus]|jgi:hypothetical protein|uniref:hypothetical protein n=1 Tax=Odoribacter splanchnicus TaxID=28118 RepID=UPI000B392CFE|nr:hypothetical protein [Odoribacter splanchnicus]OUO16595.1 hypothetical protein B5F93_00555 [Odoribacter splanchnicus]